MKYYGPILLLLLTTGCGENSSTNAGLSSLGSNDSVFFENTGNSNRLLGCFEASQVISSDQPTTGISPQVELGMSAAEIRAIAGKPRHIFQGVWTFGFDIGVNIPADPLWDLAPSTTVVSFGTTAWSGDNTLCDGTEAQFISDANQLISPGSSFGHSFEQPDCVTAARRIAARVELGMTRAQVRDVVGKPVEITVNGLWRYKFGAAQALQDAPIVQFGASVGQLPSSESSLEFETGVIFNNANDGLNETSVVIGYWSPENVCP